MWRPFASDFVAHTYEGFRKKYDKVWTVKPLQKREPYEKFDAKNLFPYRLGVEELERRQQEFAQLQVKVNDQRKKIKKKDEAFAHTQKVKIQTQREEDLITRSERKQSILRIRSMASNKIPRNKSCNNQDYYDTTFALTSLERTAFISKNDSVASKLTALAPVSRSKLKLS